MSPFSTVFVRCITAIFSFLIWPQVHATSDHIELGIVAHPQSMLAENGKSVTLAVLLKGPVKSIQWRLNGEPIDYADQFSFKTPPTESKFKPDEYDVVVQDAFGNVLVSEKAIVYTAETGSALLQSKTKSLETTKLQTLFNLIHVFDQIDSRVTDPLLDWRKHHSFAEEHFQECPNRVRVQFIELEKAASLNHHALRVEMNSCFVPRVNFMGAETGAIVNGLLVKSTKDIQLVEKDIRVIEKMAKNLSLSFPYSANPNNNETVDFDIVVDGKLTQTIDSRRPQANVRIIREEYLWSKGTKLQNTQTKVQAEFISGKFIKESFGSFKRNIFNPSRETELFEKLKIKIGEDEVLIDGMVTKIIDETGTHRSGEFKVSVNGKSVVSAPSGISPTSDIKGKLPIAPKLNGSFVNDHFYPSKSTPK